MWWASLTQEQRDTLRAEFPDRLTPHGLQCMCKQTHPEWSKNRKSGVCISNTNLRTRRPKPKTAAPKQSDGEAQAEHDRPKLTKKDMERLKEAGEASRMVEKTKIWRLRTIRKPQKPPPQAQNAGRRAARR
jgi:hypothetical protein